MSKVLKHFKIIRYQAKFSTLLNRHLNILITRIARKSRDQKFWKSKVFFVKNFFVVSDFEETQNLKSLWPKDSRHEIWVDRRQKKFWHGRVPPLDFSRYWGYLILKNAHFHRFQKHLKMNPGINFILTRKYPLRGYILGSGASRDPKGQPLRHMEQLLLVSWGIWSY